VPEDERELEAVSSRPDALVLFNPVFDNGPDGFGHERIGERYPQISPIHNLDRGGLPPTVVFLGTEDRLVPVATAERYRDLMEAHGNRCELHLYEGQQHGFFNHDAGKTPYYERTVEVMDRFLAELMFLPDA
jgi:acetyl esterase/lipase